MGLLTEYWGDSHKLDTELLLTKLHPSHTLPEAETLRRKHLETRVKAVP